MRLFELAAATATVEVIPPFRAIPGEAGAMAGFDYALPVDPLTSTLAVAVERLRAVYRAMGEPLRVEFNASRWPGLAAALASAGLQQQARTPLMVCDPSDFRPIAVPSVGVTLEPQDPNHPGRMRGCGLVGGRTAARGSIGGLDGVAELYGVVTEPAFRRQGVASALCSALVGWHFERCANAAAHADARSRALVFLEAETPHAEALYEKLGFRQVDWRLGFADI